MNYVERYGQLFSTPFLAIVLTAALIFDLRYQKIPNWLTIGTLILAVSYHTLLQGLPGLLFALEGGALGTSVLILPFLMGGMGAGDAKLMGAIGSMLGPKDIFIAFILTALIGGIYAVAVVIYCGNIGITFNRYRGIIKTFFLTKKILYVPPSASEKCPRLRYGVAIALGVIISALMKETIYEMLHLN